MAEHPLLKKSGNSDPYAFKRDNTSKLAHTAIAGLTAAGSVGLWKASKKFGTAARIVSRLTSIAMGSTAAAHLEQAMSGDAHADELQASHAERQARHAETPSVSKPSSDPMGFGRVGNGVLAVMNGIGAADMATMARRSPSKLGKLGFGAASALMASLSAVSVSNAASADEAPKNPDGKTKSPADLKKYAQQVVDAKYMTGNAGDEHPKVARQNGKADRALAAARTAHSNPAAARALLAQPLGGPTDAPSNDPGKPGTDRTSARDGVNELRKGIAGVDKMHANNPAKRVRERVQFGIERGKANSDLRNAQASDAPHKTVEAGVQAQKHASPQQKTAKHPKASHELKQGWWIKNAKGKTFWHKAHK